MVLISVTICHIFSGFFTIFVAKGHPFVAKGHPFAAKGHLFRRPGHEQQFIGIFKKQIIQIDLNFSNDNFQNEYLYPHCFWKTISNNGQELCSKYICNFWIQLFPILFNSFPEKHPFVSTSLARVYVYIILKQGNNLPILPILHLRAYH